jgi:hypothetical protein
VKLSRALEKHLRQVARRPLLALLSARLFNCLRLASKRLALLLARSRRFVERLALPLVDDEASQEMSCAESSD